MSALAASASRARSPFVLNSAWQWILFATLASYALDGPLRYVLSLAHAESAIYLRDAFGFATVMYALLHWVTGGKPSPGLSVMAVLLVHAFWGMLILPNLFQPLMGIKVFLSFALGACCFETFTRHEPRFMRLFVILFLISAVGVAINWFVDMPWAGVTYATAAGDVTASREWTMAGIKRIAGFTRASFEASTNLAILCAPLLVLTRVPWWLKAASYAVTMALILATTSKGSVVAFLLVGLCLPLILSTRHKQKINILLYCLPLLVIGIPALLAMYEIRADLDGPIGWALSSFAERINQMWPEAFRNVTQHGNIILGRGVGGIGFPQKFGDGLLYNSADNVMVYLYVSFGLPALVYVYLIIRSLSHHAVRLSPAVWACFMVWLVHWFAYGLTGNDIEAPFMQFFSGLIVGGALSLRDQGES